MNTYLIYMSVLTWFITTHAMHNPIPQQDISCNNDTPNFTYKDGIGHGWIWHGTFIPCGSLLLAALTNPPLQRAKSPVGDHLVEEPRTYKKHTRSSPLFNER